MKKSACLKGVLFPTAKVMRFHFRIANVLFQLCIHFFNTFLEAYKWFSSFKVVIIWWKGILWGRFIYLALLFDAVASTCQHKAVQCVNLPGFSVALPQMDFVLGGAVCGFIQFFPPWFVFAQFFPELLILA